MTTHCRAGSPRTGSHRPLRASLSCGTRSRRQSSQSTRRRPCCGGLQSPGSSPPPQSWAAAARPRSRTGPPSPLPCLVAPFPAGGAPPAAACPEGPAVPPDLPTQPHNGVNTQGAPDNTRQQMHVHVAPRSRDYTTPIWKHAAHLLGHHPRVLDSIFSWRYVVLLGAGYTQRSSCLSR